MVCYRLSMYDVVRQRQDIRISSFATRDLRCLPDDVEVRIAAIQEGRTRVTSYRPFPVLDNYNT